MLEARTSVRLQAPSGELPAELKQGRAHQESFALFSSSVQLSNVWHGVFFFFRRPVRHLRAPSAHATLRRMHFSARAVIRPVSDL